MEHTSNQDSQESNGLLHRVDEIEKTIGDLAQVFDALKNSLAKIPIPPTCPPYCAHELDRADKDELPLPERVADIKKYIGDFGLVFDELNQALDKLRPPTCPPYCAHESEGGGDDCY
jgi:hypothetical protein